MLALCSYSFAFTLGGAPLGGLALRTTTPCMADMANGKMTFGVSLIKTQLCGLKTSNCSYQDATSPKCCSYSPFYFVVTVSLYSQKLKL